MSDLVAFLRARYDEDAEKALAASPGPWSPNAEADEVVACDGITVADGFALSGRQLRATVEHIAEWDPARVLADVDAKRRILERAVAEIESQDPPRASAIFASGVLLLLALPYADHPDYRQEWRL